MQSFVKFLPFLGSLYSFSEATPLYQPSVTFAPLSRFSPGTAHNIVVQYSGDVDGEVTITYGSCGADVNILSVGHRIGATHVGSHPLASRHTDHEDRRPTKFVWVAPEDLSEGCLSAFLDSKLVGQSAELTPIKRRVRRSEKKAFAEVAGEDGMWFNGVAYLQQKQPEEVFVASAKNKSFAILGGGISGLATSVS